MLGRYMRVIKARFRIEKVNGEKILRNIEKAGKNCYKSEHTITKNIQSAKDFVRMIIKNGHESVLEHEKVTVRIICDRGVTHEIVRHRIASYSQESTRYCNYTKAIFGKQITVINIRPHIMGGNPLKEWRKAMRDAEQHYFKLIEFGVKPQIARSVLPNSLKTEIVCTFNLREWRHVFKLRAESEKAHPQMRDIMVPLLWEFKKKIPVVFDDIMDDDEEERRSKMVTLDFSKCKTSEDVEKIFKEHEKEFDVIKRGLRQIAKMD